MKFEGHRDCPACGGKGETIGQATCEACGGSGVVIDRSEPVRPCPECATLRARLAEAEDKTAATMRLLDERNRELDDFECAVDDNLPNYEVGEDEANRIERIEEAGCELDRVTKERDAARAEAERMRALLKEMLANVERSWTFDDGQRHTHSWHDLQDFRERWHKRIDAALGEEKKDA